LADTLTPALSQRERGSVDKNVSFDSIADLI